MLKKKIMLVVFFALCLLHTVYIGAAGILPYDPWSDINDDGIIDVEDLTDVSLRLWEEGTPINKTELLLDLLSRVEALEAKFPVTTDNIADGAITRDKIRDYAINNIKLASGSIPYATASAVDVIYTTSTSFVDLMSVSLTLEQRSFLIIMFSAEAYVSPAGEGIYIRALLNNTRAYPKSDTIYLTTVNAWQCHSFTFYHGGDTGTYTVKITWRVSGGAGVINDRSLVVVALP